MVDCVILSRVILGLCVICCLSGSGCGVMCVILCSGCCFCFW